MFASRGPLDRGRSSPFARVPASRRESRSRRRRGDGEGDARVMRRSRRRRLPGGSSKPRAAASRRTRSGPRSTRPRRSGPRRKRGHDRETRCLAGLSSRSTRCRGVGRGRAACSCAGSDRERRVPATESARCRRLLQSLAAQAGTGSARAGSGRRGSSRSPCRRKWGLRSQMAWVAAFPSASIALIVGVGSMTGRSLPWTIRSMP
jgi:hypothetical protein